MGRIKVGVVGCGVWGFNHLRILNEFGVLKCACDVNEQIRYNVWHQHQIPVYADSLTMYQDYPIKLDAAVVCVPHSDLAKETLRALAHDLHVFVEKPVALNSFDAWHIWACQRETGKIVYPGYLEYFNKLVDQHKGKPALLFKRHNPWVKDRHLVWDTLIHDISLTYKLKPKWALFDCAWTHWIRHRTINGKDIYNFNGSLERELEHFIYCIAGIEKPKVDMDVATQTTICAEAICEHSPHDFHWKRRTLPALHS